MPTELNKGNYKDSKEVLRTSTFFVAIPESF